MPDELRPIDPALATKLSDARRQLHHASQLLVAAGISYLKHEPDDSHTNLAWDSELGALTSRAVQSFKLGLQFDSLTLLVLDERSDPAASLPLSGQTIATATAWLREQIAARGADAAKLTLEKHYTIHDHAVGHGAAFDARDTAAFDQLARWYGGAAVLLEEIRSANGGAEVRCWPHHFDIATLIEPGPGKSIGVGMEPGDGYYDEPYYYVNAHPSLKDPPTPALEGGGIWHTHEWFGAVLPASRMGTSQQRRQIESFLESAIAASRRMLASG